MLTKLMELEQKSKWEEIISTYAVRRIEDTHTAGVVGKAYRMLGEYGYAIANFKKGYKLAADNFTKAKFIIQVADCSQLMEDSMEADIKLSFIDTLKFSTVGEGQFINGWKNLQSAKYENNREERQQQLMIAQQNLEASWVRDEYDKLLRKRLLITAYQQLFELELEKGNLKGAENFLMKAQYNSDELALEYERVSNYLMEARLALARENYGAVRNAANVVIKAALTQRMITAAEEILKKIPAEK